MRQQGLQDLRQKLADKRLYFLGMYVCVHTHTPRNDIYRIYIRQT